MSARSSSSLAPARSGPRRSVPALAKRQVTSCPSAVRRARVQSPQKGRRHARDDADLAAPVAVAPALGHLAAVARARSARAELRVEALARSRRPAPPARAPSRSALPTSMYSMKRTTWPVPRKRRASSTIVWSFTPRCTTQLILIGASPARLRRGDAARARASTASFPPFMRRKTSGSRLSRLTVTRRSPACASAGGQVAGAARRSW